MALPEDERHPVHPPCLQPHCGHSDEVHQLRVRAHFLTKRWGQRAWQRGGGKGSRQGNGGSASSDIDPASLEPPNCGQNPN